jgi:hypothetical protein
MATINNVHVNSETLIQQLGDLKFIVETNKDVLTQNLVAYEFLGFKVDIANNLIEELLLWEEIGNQSKCISLFNDAQFFLEQVNFLVDRMFEELCAKAWLDSQRELQFVEYITIPHEYVLKETREHIALAA